VYNIANILSHFMGCFFTMFVVFLMPIHFGVSISLFFFFFFLQYFGLKKGPNAC
jgi:amino acid transporter